MGLRQALPVQPPSAAEAASVAALLQSRPTPYRTRGPITVGRSCQQGPRELQLGRRGAQQGEQFTFLGRELVGILVVSFPDQLEAAGQEGCNHGGVDGGP